MSNCIHNKCYGQEGMDIMDKLMDGYTGMMAS